MKKKADLEQQAKDTKRWLQNATRLDDALGAELGRWSQVVVKLESSLTWLVGNVLLSSGMIAYGGAFVASYRKSMQNAWITLCTKQNVPVDPNFTLENVLGNDVTTIWASTSMPRQPPEHSLEHSP